MPSRLKPSAASFRALRNNHHALHAEEHSCRPSRRALWALLRMRQLCVSKHAGRLYAGHAIVIQLIERALRQFDPVDFDALHALTCREANALLGHQRGNARSPERAGMHINICAARLRNDESKALLLIEKFDVAVAHRAGALARSPLRPRSAAAKSSAAESPAARRLRLRRGEIDAVHIRHLHSALAIRHIAKHSRPLRKLRGRKTCQCGRMTERIRTIFQGDEAKTFCRIKPFYCCALRAKAGAGTGMIEIRHDENRCIFMSRTCPTGSWRTRAFCSRCSPCGKMLLAFWRRLQARFGTRFGWLESRLREGGTLGGGPSAGIPRKLR